MYCTNSSSLLSLRGVTGVHRITSTPTVTSITAYRTNRTRHASIEGPSLLSLSDMLYHQLYNTSQYKLRSVRQERMKFTNGQDYPSFSSNTYPSPPFPNASTSVKFARWVKNTEQKVPYCDKGGTKMATTTPFDGRFANEARPHPGASPPSHAHQEFREIRGVGKHLPRMWGYSVVGNNLGQTAHRQAGRRRSQTEEDWGARALLTYSHSYNSRNGMR